MLRNKRGKFKDEMKVLTQEETNEKKGYKKPALNNKTLMLLIGHRNKYGRRKKSR